MVVGVIHYGVMLQAIYQLNVTRASEIAKWSWMLFTKGDMLQAKYQSNVTRASEITKWSWMLFIMM